MASMTFWTRLETHVHQASVDEGLQARVYDPLWLLARQWQIGEFTGEDAGTPVSIRMRGDRLPLSQYYPGQWSDKTVAVDYDSAHLPLEMLVERESIDSPKDAGQDLRLAAEMGLHFFSLLGGARFEKLRQDYLSLYPLKVPSDVEEVYLDPESRRFLAVMARRAPDGLQLYTDLKRTLQLAGGGLPSLPAQPKVLPSDRSEVIFAGLTFLALYEGVYGEGLPKAGEISAWNAQRMEYSFAVSAPAPEGKVVLVSSEYPGGRLDWEDFNVASSTTRDTKAGPPSEQFVCSVIPTHARYHGMPANRWWEFEDAQVNFGLVSVAPDELMRLLLVEFALTYGNDWFVAPVEVPVGAIYRTQSLVVTDSFGVRTLVPHYSEVDAPGSGWSMFAIDRLARQPDTTNTSPQLSPPEPPDAKNRNLLFLPPVLAASIQGPVLEQVLLVRDEMANMAWAVERMIYGLIGQPMDRVEAYHRFQTVNGNGQADHSSSGQEAMYRLTRPVPDYWFPLVPVRENQNNPEIRLRRGRVLLDEGNEPVLPGARGRILEPGEPLSLFEEEVPRTGVKISLAYQAARGIGGSAHLWLGRQKLPGRGEGSSGLRFDQIVEQPNNNE